MSEPVRQDSLPEETSSNPDASKSIPEFVGRYRVKNLLESSDTAATYLGFDPTTNRDVVIRTLKTSEFGTPEQIAQFLGGARAASNLNHANIVPVFESDTSSDFVYIASGVVEGRTLTSELANSPEQRIEPNKAALIGEKLAAALDYAHKKGVFHRNLNPASVFLDAAGEPYLANFGLAPMIEPTDKQLAESRVQTGGLICLNPDKRAERVPRDVDNQLDLGVIIYEMTTGKRPDMTGLGTIKFNPPERARLLNRRIPRDFDEIIAKCIDRSSFNRYASCENVAEDIRRFRDGKLILARKYGVRGRVARFVSRRPIFSSVLMILSASVCIAGWIGYQRRAEEIKTQIDNRNYQLEMANYSRLFDRAMLHWQEGDNQGALELLHSANPDMMGLEADFLETLCANQTRRIPDAGDRSRFCNDDLWVAVWGKNDKTVRALEVSTLKEVRNVRKLGKQVIFSFSGDRFCSKSDVNDEFETWSLHMGKMQDNGALPGGCSEIIGLSESGWVILARGFDGDLRVIDRLRQNVTIIKTGISAIHPITAMITPDSLKVHFCRKSFPATEVLDHGKIQIWDRLQEKLLDPINLPAGFATLPLIEVDLPANGLVFTYMEKVPEGMPPVDGRRRVARLRKDCIMVYESRSRFLPISSVGNLVLDVDNRFVVSTHDKEVKKITSGPSSFRYQDKFCDVSNDGKWHLYGDHLWRDRESQEIAKYGRQHLNKREIAGQFVVDQEYSGGSRRGEVRRIDNGELAWGTQFNHGKPDFVDHGKAFILRNQKSKYFSALCETISGFSRTYLEYFSSNNSVILDYGQYLPKIESVLQDFDYFDMSVEHIAKSSVGYNYRSNGLKSRFGEKDYFGARDKFPDYDLIDSNGNNKRFDEKNPTFKTCRSLATNRFAIWANSVQIRSLSDCSLLYTIKPELIKFAKRKVCSVEFASDLNSIYTGSDVGIIRKIKIDTSLEICSFQIGKSAIKEIVAHPSKDRFAVVSEKSNLVEVWDCKTKALVFPPIQHEVESLSMGFTPDGKFLITCGKGIRVWDAETGKLISLLPDSEWVDLIGVDPAGFVVVGTAETNRFVYKKNDGSPEGPKSVEIADTSIDRLKIQRIASWSMKDWKQEYSHFELPFGYSIAMADDKSVTVLCEVGDFRVDLSGNSKPEMILVNKSDQSGNVYEPSFVSGSLNPDHIICRAVDGKTGLNYRSNSDSKLAKLFYWDLINNKSISEFNKDNKNQSLSGGVISPDGRLAAVTLSEYRDPTIVEILKVFELPKMIELCRLEINLKSIRFSPDSRRIIVTSDARKDERRKYLPILEDRKSFGIHILDARSTQMLLELSPNMSSSQAVLDPSQRYLLADASIRNEQYVATYQIRQEIHHGTFRGHRGPVRQLRFSPDGKRLLSIGVPASGSSYSGDVRIWDLATQKQLRMFEISEGRLISAWFSNDGNFLYISTSKEHRSPDSRVAPELQCRLSRWDIASGRLVTEIDLGKAPVVHLSAREDGKQIAVLDHRNNVVLRNASDLTLQKSFSADPLLEGAQNISCNDNAFKYLDNGRKLLSQHRIIDIETEKEHSLFDDIQIGKELDDRQKLVSSVLIDDSLRPLAVHCHNDVFSVKLDGKLTYKVNNSSINALHPSGSYVVSAINNDFEFSSLYVWQITHLREPVFKESSHKSEWIQAGHFKNITCLQFSPDGRYLVTGGDDRTIKLWDMSSFKKKE